MEKEEVGTQIADPNAQINLIQAKNNAADAAGWLGLWPTEVKTGSLWSWASFSRFSSW